MNIRLTDLSWELLYYLDYYESAPLWQIASELRRTESACRFGLLRLWLACLAEQPKQDVWKVTGKGEQWVGEAIRERKAGV